MRLKTVSFTKNFHADAKDRFLMETITVEADIDEGEKATEVLAKLRQWTIHNGPVLEGNPTTDSAMIGGKEMKVGDSIKGVNGSAQITNINKANPDFSQFDYIYDLPYSKKGFNMEEMRLKIKKAGGVFNGVDKKWYSSTYHEELREFLTSAKNQPLPPGKQVQIFKKDGSSQVVDVDDDIPDSWDDVGLPK